MGFIYPPESNVFKINASDYDRLTTDPSPLFIHFGAEWNGYDYVLRRTVSKFSRTLIPKVRFGYIDVDIPDHWPRLRGFNVYNVPYCEYHIRGIALGTQ